MVGKVVKQQLLVTVCVLNICENDMMLSSFSLHPRQRSEDEQVQHLQLAFVLTHHELEGSEQYKVKTAKGTKSPIFALFKQSILQMIAKYATGAQSSSCQIIYIFSIR
jgi:hypothetical protein